MDRMQRARDEAIPAHCMNRAMASRRQFTGRKPLINALIDFIEIMVK